MAILKTLMLTALVIGGCFVFPVLASVAIVGGDWSHAGCAALAVSMNAAICWLADGKLK
jgi:hypothetical protein